MLDIDTSYLRQTFSVRDLTTGEVIMRQATIWHPTTDAGEAVSSDTVTKGGGGGGGAIWECFAATQENLPLHVLTVEPGGRLEGAEIGTA